MARMIGTTQTLDVVQDIDTTFEWVVHPDTPIVLVNTWGPMAGFKGYELQSGDWSQPGDSRRITLDDGSQATESITTRDAPTYFDYVVNDFSSPILKAGLTKAFGQWWFSSLQDGGTHVVWTYSLEPRNALAIPFIWLFMKTVYRSYVKAAMESMRHISEGEGLVSASSGA